jgi:hypothetical protein
MNPLREWAWRQYNQRTRTVPNTDECRAAWKIHLAAGAVETIKGEDIMVVKAKERPTQIEPPTVIVSITSMDTEQFAIHFTRRHKGSLAGQAELPKDMTFEIEQMYRSFHQRLHETRVGYKHEHEPPDIEYSVDRAIESLIENHNWGWKELAGINGMVAVFPDGQIATRIDRKIKHHETIEDATDRLVQAS